MPPAPSIYTAAQVARMLDRQVSALTAEAALCRTSPEEIERRFRELESFYTTPEARQRIAIGRDRWRLMYCPPRPAPPGAPPPDPSADPLGLKNPITLLGMTLPLWQWAGGGLVLAIILGQIAKRRRRR